MPSVEVTPISLPEDTVRFVKTWFPIYENDPSWVAPLILRTQAFLRPETQSLFQGGHGSVLHRDP